MRAEKGTPNQNAARTLLPGAILAVLILLGADPALRVYDEHLRVRPWVSAEVEIVPRAEGGKPDILYTVHAPEFVSGSWKAWTQAAASGRRLCGGDGSGTYSARNSITKSWSWYAFLETDCALPVVEFQMCVSYNVKTARNVPGHFGPFCSEPYDPGSAAK